MGAIFPPLPSVICKQQAPELETTSALPPLPQPPLAPAAPMPPAQGAPSMDELIQQSQWNLQQQEQHLLALRQVWGQLCFTPLALRWLPGAHPMPGFLQLYVGTSNSCQEGSLARVSAEDGAALLPGAQCALAAVTQCCYHPWCV